MFKQHTHYSLTWAGRDLTRATLLGLRKDFTRDDVAVEVSIVR